MDPQLKHLAPGELEIHPILHGFPEQAPDQYENLKASIAAQGIKVELRGVIVPQTGRIAIYSGRGRRKSAIELGLSRVPVLVNGIAENSLMEFVIDEVTTGRQLTKSGVVLLLFEKHPALVKQAKKRKSNLAKANGKNRNHAKNGDGVHSVATIGKNSEAADASYREIAERYKVPYQYFTLLAELHKKCSAEDWVLVRKAIIEEQVAITRIYAGQAGRDCTKGKHKAQTDYARLCYTSLVSVKSAFKNWKKVDFEHRQRIVALWNEIAEMVPEDLQGEQV